MPICASMPPCATIGRLSRPRCSAAAAPAGDDGGGGGGDADAVDPGGTEIAHEQAHRLAESLPPVRRRLFGPARQRLARGVGGLALAEHGAPIEVEHADADAAGAEVE